MRSRFKAIWLIGLCLLMQVISVYPHHHHADALCTAHDMKTASPAGSPQPCTAGCITHFSLTVPVTAISLHSQKTIRHHKNSITPDRIIGFAQLSHTVQNRQKTYHTVFYASPPISWTAWRAPPCLSASYSEEE